MIIARTANVAGAKLLLDKGANPNAKETQRGQTPLMWAAAGSQAAMMRELLARGAEVDAKSDTGSDERRLWSVLEPRAQPRPPGGMTAMLFSVREGCLDCVKALVDKGAKLDLPDPEGVTPLISAIFNTHFDVAKYLIDKGANINRWDWWGRSPLYLAVDYNTLPHGGRPDQPAIDETLPIDVIRILPEKGANPNLQFKLASRDVNRADRRGSRRGSDADCGRRYAATARGQGAGRASHQAVARTWCHRRFAQ